MLNEAWVHFWRIELPLFPAGSVAKTSKVWSPFGMVERVNGERQDWKEAASTRHWNWTPDSEAEKVKVEERSIWIDGGAAVI